MLQLAIVSEIFRRVASIVLQEQFSGTTKLMNCTEIQIPNSCLGLFKVCAKHSPSMFYSHEWMIDCWLGFWHLNPRQKSS